jgi:hypothetical protein
LKVGDSVEIDGDAVGLKVGETVGDLVGTAVGRAVGETVGETEGRPVGELDVDTVGSSRLPTEIAANAAEAPAASDFVVSVSVISAGETSDIVCAIASSCPAAAEIL